jgi:hypothetical protein
MNNRGKRKTRERQWRLHFNYSLKKRGKINNNTNRKSRR